MGFAEDKVYDHILKNLNNFKNIRVASLADSLSCLTDSDRDELHAREETRGSQATVYKFYQHLKCRQGWVPDLISALRHNNAGHLADELQHVYDSWQRPSSASPAISIGALKPSPEPNPAPSAPLAEQLCPDLPVGDRRSLQPSAATTTTTSTDLDARTPVQESLPKNLVEPETPWLPLPGGAARDGVGEEGHLSHPTVAMGTPGVGSVAVPPAVPPVQGRDWLSRPQHPVCVDNGCFGNANHLHRGTPGLALGRALPPRAQSPEQPRNEPREDSYFSTESPPRLEEATGSEGLQPPDSPPKKPTVPSSKHGDPPGSLVDVRSPLLIQQQFDVEQKRVTMLQEHGGDRGARMETAIPVPTPAPRDSAPSCDTSMKPPVQETKLPVGEAAGGSCSVLEKDRVLPASVDPLLPAGGSSEGTSGRMASRGSSATSIWSPCSNTERDVELSKPGVLSVTGESPEVAGRCLSSQGPSGHYSKVSDSLTFRSDPLLVSTDSSSSGRALSRVSSGCQVPAAGEDPRGEEEAAGASRDSHPSLRWDSSSLGTHEVRVDRYPSSQLETGNNLQDGADARGDPPGFDSRRGHGAVTDSSEARASPGDSSGPSLPYILPAVGIAVISAVAFLVYTRLQK
ncbi:mitochondrial antiviral-signaling protein [Aegotheles albertisi]